jgi:hypothetical protein
MLRRPSWLLTVKAACASSLCEMALLRRGRGPCHVQRVVIGTQEARPGPSIWSSRGAQSKGRPEFCAELRPGVGLVHSTAEAAEQRLERAAEAVEGRGQPERIS